MGPEPAPAEGSEIPADSIPEEAPDSPSVPDWARDLDAVIPDRYEFSAPPAVAEDATVADRLGSAVQKFFTKLTDWLSTLPPTPLIRNLEGALLMVRRSFGVLNLDPIASPVQTSFNPEDLTQAITGTVGAEDPEGDSISFDVVTGPQYGTVAVDENGEFVYTPGEGFTGQDSFEVMVRSGDAASLEDAASEDRSPFDDSMKVTIVVGENAPTNPLADGNIRDVALSMNGVPVALSIDEKNPLTKVQRASVVLRAGDEFPVTWLDDQGNIGAISVGDLVEQWQGFTSAGNVRLGVDFELEDFSAASVILTSVAAAYVADRDVYVFSGILAPDPVDAEGIDSYYDITGGSAKTSYENFRATYLDAADFNGVELFLGSADVYADSYSVRDYEDELEGTDPGLTFDELGLDGTSVGPALASADTSVSQKVLAMLAMGNQAVIGTGSGEVKLWDGENWNRLSQFNSPVNTMIAYRGGFVVGLGDGSVQQWSTTITDLTDGLAASAFTVFNSSGTYLSGGSDPEGPAYAFDNSVSTKYLQRSAVGSGVTIDFGIGRAAVVKGLGLTTANDVENRDPASYEVWGSSDGTNFAKISDGTLAPPSGRLTAYSDIAFENTTAYRYYRVVFPTVRASDGGTGCASGCMQIAEIRLPGAGWTTLQNAGGGQPVSTMTAYRDGFVVGLGGSTGGVNQVRYWTGSQWQELEGSKWAQPISTMLPYGNGIVVGLGGSNRGGVWEWNGTSWTQRAGESQSGFKSAVTEMVPFRGGYLVGLANGTLQHWEPTSQKWNLWRDPNYRAVNSIAVTGNGEDFTVGFSDGSVIQYKLSTNKYESLGPGWGQAVNAMLPLGGGVVVGLGKGAVEYWDRHPIDDVTDGLVPQSYSAVLGEGQNPKEPVYQAFDDKIETKYLNYRGPGSGAIIDLGAGNSAAVDGILLYSGNDQELRDPVSYALLGSNDGKTYTPVAAGDLAAPAKRGDLYLPVEFDNTTAYRYYKLTFPKLRGLEGCDNKSNDSGCMQIAEIRLPGFKEKPSWNELQGTGWGAAVTKMIPYRDGFLVGLANGSVQQWTPESGFTELSASRIPFTKQSLVAAVESAEKYQNAVDKGEQKVKLTDWMLGVGHPLFAPGSPYLPQCSATNSCAGSFYPILQVTPTGPLKYTDTSGGKPVEKETTWTAKLGPDKQSFVLSYDLGYGAQGYVYVPEGLWPKLKPTNYSAAMLATLTTGPSMTLNLGKGTQPDAKFGPVTIVEGTLTQKATQIGVFDIQGKLEGQLTAKLEFPEGFSATQLNASAYVYAGVLTTFNTQVGNGFKVGYQFNDPITGDTLNWGDFAKIQGVTITPELIPTITAGYGLFYNGIPFIGDLTLMKLNVGYTNPVALPTSLNWGNGVQASVKLRSSGTLSYGAAVLPKLTKKLTYKDKYKLYGPKEWTLWQYPSSN